MSVGQLYIYPFNVVYSITVKICKINTHVIRGVLPTVLLPKIKW